MEPTWHDVTERYGVELAPPGLHVSQALVNSVAAREEIDADPLGALDTALPWLRSLIGEWVTVHGGPEPTMDLTDHGVARVRRLRSAVQDALLRASTEHLRTRVTVTAHGDQVRAVPIGRNEAWLESALGVELLLAHQNDTLRRLKLCRNPLCRIAFFDLSKNNSKVWHDKDQCGAPLHARDYRRRLREPAASGE